MVFVWPVAAQDAFILTAPPPPAVTSVSASYSGAPGNATYYYWVIARYSGGGSAPARSNEVRNVGPLGGGNAVTVGWSPVPGATSYDVLRTNEPSLPASCACAVQTGVAGLSLVDSGAALSPYSLQPAGAARAQFVLDNSTGNPEVKLYVNGLESSLAGGSANYAESFTNATSVTLDHQFDTYDVLVTCYDNATPPAYIEWDSLDLTNTNQATVNFLTQQSGRCVVVAAGNPPPQVGVGLSRVDAVISVDENLVPTFLTASSSLDFGSILAGGCSALTFPLSGVAQTDGIAPGWPHSLEDGLVGIMFANAANSVTVRLCNVTGSPIDPGNHNFRATVVRSF